MWKGFLSSIGIGGVKIHTLLEKSNYRKGENIRGKVLIRGGYAAEPIRTLILSLFHRVEGAREDSDFSYHDKDLKEMAIPINRHIKPKEEITIPFSFEIGTEYPTSDIKNKIFLKTTAVIPQAVDPSDQDELTILSKEH